MKSNLLGITLFHQQIPINHPDIIAYILIINKHIHIYSDLLYIMVLKHQMCAVVIICPTTHTYLSPTHIYVYKKVNKV